MITKTVICFLMILFFLSCTRNQEGNLKKEYGDSSAPSVMPNKRTYSKAEIDDLVIANRNRLLMGNFWDQMTLSEFEAVAYFDSLKFHSHAQNYYYYIRVGESLFSFKMSPIVIDNKVNGILLIYIEMTGIIIESSSSSPKDNIIKLFKKKYGTPKVNKELDRYIYVWNTPTKEIEIQESIFTNYERRNTKDREFTITYMGGSLARQHKEKKQSQENKALDKI